MVVFFLRWMGFVLQNGFVGCSRHRSALWNVVCDDYPFALSEHGHHHFLSNDACAFIEFMIFYSRDLDSNDFWLFSDDKGHIS